MKTIVIDFLYLDLNTCERCLGTDQVLENVIADIAPALINKDYTITLRKTKIDSVERAFQYHFVSSPTILVNGIDILGEVKENLCESCGDICGTETLCRVFEYEGNFYNEPPYGLLKEGILKAINGTMNREKKSMYQIPGNIMNFIAKN
ncbi:MAG: hypothetical protein A2Y20_04930 [Firmicutes bacterium GWF2_51_9]|nr:MAG: hypothetical protein A2Y20_04930 [Firmicutes bacterium GWF2_51_9]OGS57405.1 MAG: hypothetical protein A2Y19_02765 [Firmicutes bacterium GWE2_51_13]HAM63145.1 ferredoxin [Erysipelotrichaceae bacterium]HBZ41523.1 ferredoxin [Erysipelotrichaceae bacterium]